MTNHKIYFQSDSIGNRTRIFGETVRRNQPLYHRAILSNIISLKDSCSLREKRILEVPVFRYPLSTSCRNRTRIWWLRTIRRKPLDQRGLRVLGFGIEPNSHGLQPCAFTWLACQAYSEWSRTRTYSVRRPRGYSPLQYQFCSSTHLDWIIIINHKTTYLYFVIFVMN